VPVGVITGEHFRLGTRHTPKIKTAHPADAGAGTAATAAGAGTAATVDAGAGTAATVDAGAGTAAMTQKAPQSLLRSSAAEAAAAGCATVFSSAQSFRISCPRFTRFIGQVLRLLPMTQKALQSLLISPIFQDQLPAFYARI
jgi:hypothetical protein